MINVTICNDLNCLCNELSHLLQSAFEIRERFSEAFSFGIVGARISVWKGVSNIYVFMHKNFFLFIKTTSMKTSNELYISVKTVISTIISSFDFHHYATGFEFNLSSLHMSFKEKI